jgi:enoyl-CoA hydratase/carnithine racemase
VADITAQLAANSPLSMKATKTAFRELLRPGAAEIEGAIRSVYGSADFHAAVRAFLDKRRHDWTGR